MALKVPALNAVQRQASITAPQWMFSTGKYVVLVIFALISLFPLLWMWLAALRNRNEVLANPFALPKSMDFGNLAEAWTVGRFGDYFLNSVITTAPTVAGVVALSCLAGYGFARFVFRGRNFTFYAFLLGLMVPFQSIMIPLYYELRDLGMLGTYWAFILPAVALGLPFGIFLMQAYFRGIPADLADAARIDGCSELQIFWYVMLPLAGPAVATLTVFQFVWTWNAFLMPLLYLQSESLRPIPLGMMFFQGRYTSDIGLLAAGVTIATVPVIIVYLIFQRQFIRGITAGAVK